MHCQNGKRSFTIFSTFAIVHNTKTMLLYYEIQSFLFHMK